MDDEIESFLASHFILTLSTFDGSTPYSTPLFYVLFHEGLFFLSDVTTKHAQDVIKNSIVSASVHTYTREVKNIQGIQLVGVCKLIKNTREIQQNDIFQFEEKSWIVSEIYKFYLEKFPEAHHIPSYLWGIFPFWIKFTNNQNYFGYKKIWRQKNDFSHRWIQLNL
ncbi:MAG: pyridoxamine 5'-phosphate oxidase family protein [Leptospiraceae bacterium]|nr:pyridoxamine 5'-phosphate oxidase family protein [Leptospiraceae bacterium]MDW7976082.1 pyridoxamine 5'-phosphate oxidase family protein [Leptospiraceae bacterium]